MPRRMQLLLPAHAVETTRNMGWADLGNGSLLAAAADASFDCLLTVDRGLQFQQSRIRLPLAVVLLLAPNNRFPAIVLFAPHILSVLSAPLDRTIYLIQPDGTVSKRS